MDVQKGSLISGRLLARSAAWNLTGFALPALAALFVIPFLIDGMGKERFGLLAIIWMGVGYFSLFDLGLGRALTKLVAERLGAGDTDDLDSLIWTALGLLGVLGVLGAGVVLAFAGPLVERLLNVPSELQAEAVTAFHVLAAGLPLVVLTTALIGLLEAHQRFAVITAVRVPLGVLTFAGPLLTLQFTPSLAWATTALLVSRSLALAAYFLTAASIRKELRTPRLPQLGYIRPLLSFGGWLTVTNIVGPLLTYLDRFFVGALLTMTAVAYYVTPYEVLSRIEMLPQAIMGVMFPAMAVASAGNRGRLCELYAGSARLLLLMMLPITAAFFLLAPEALELGLGEDFRMTTKPVVQRLAIGWMGNALARPPFTVLQSIGRPDLVAKTHLSELFPYLLVLWLLTVNFGIAGAAAAWTLRALADAVILNELAGWQLPELRAVVGRTRVVILMVLAGFALIWLLNPLFLRLLALCAVTAAASLGLWFTVHHLRSKTSSVVSAAVVAHP
jgi:O-antigen/teichoic acid export membrane protein